MNKILLSLIIPLLFTNMGFPQDILQVPAVAGTDTLKKAVQQAEAMGISIIELITNGGLYVTKGSPKIQIHTPLTIRAAANLSEKPVIQNHNTDTNTRMLFEIMDGGSLILKGLDLDGISDSDTPAKYLIRTDDDPQAGATGISVDNPYVLKVFDCYLHDVISGSDGNFFRAYKYTFADSVIFHNCILENSGKEGIRLKEYYDVEGYGFYQVNYFEVTNCTFLNTNKDGIVVYAGDNNSQTSCPKIFINHCTFNNCGYNGSRAINAWDCDGANVKNCNITNSPTNDYSVKLYGSNSTISYSNLFNVAELKLVRDAQQGFGMMSVDPLYTDLWNGDLTLSTDSPLLGQADDGLAIGDPRWDPDYTNIKFKNDLKTANNYRLNQNYPNPFNPATNISFSLKHSGRTKLKLYNILGRELKIVFDKNMGAGIHTITFHAIDLPGGIYFYELTSSEFKAIKKMILIR